MKSIVGVMIFLVLLLGLLAWSRGGAPSVADEHMVSTVLVADVPMHDFGEISMADGVVSHTFVMQNVGTEPIVLGKMYTSCMCTEASFHMGEIMAGPYGMPGHGFLPKINATLAADETADIVVLFDPAAHGPAGVGYIQRTVTVENSAGAPFIVSFTAQVTP